MTGLGDVGTAGGGSVGSGTPGGHMGGDVGEHGGFSNPTQYWYTPGMQGQDDGDLVFVRIGSSQDTPQTRARAALTNPGWNQEIAMGQPTVGAYVESVAESRGTSTAPSPATTGTQTTAGTTQYGASSTGLASGTGALTSDIDGILSGYVQDASEATSNLRRFNLTEQASFIPSQGALTGGDYSSQFVDFGREYYGLRALGDWTSIGVDPDDDETEDPDYRPSDAETGDGADTGMDALASLSSPNAFENGVNFGFGATNFGGSFSEISPSTYVDSLTSLGLTDLVGSVGIDILGPVLSGNFDDISFRDAFGSVPEDVKDGAKSLAKKESWTADNIAKKGLGAAFSSMPMGSMVGGILNGQTVKNAFGHDSLRPSGLLGIIADAVHYTQFNDMASIKASSQAVQGLADFTGMLADYDTGFALDFGMGGITRSSGSRTYTGNMRGLSHEQAVALEAMSRGYAYRGFRTDGKNGMVEGTSIASSGGMQIDPSNPFAGYISSTGNPVNAVGQGAYYATMDQVNAFASSYNVSPSAVQTALNNARANRGTFQENITAEIEANLAGITQSQLDGTYQPGTVAGFVGTPVGGAPGTGTYQSGITGWAGTGNLGNVTAGGAAFGPGTPGYSPSFDEDDLGYAPSAPSAPAPAPAAPAAPSYSDPYDSGYGTNDGDGLGGPSGDEAGYGAGGGFGLSHAKGGKVQGYAMGTPPAGVQASRSGFIDRPPSQVTEAGKVADNRPMKAKEGTYIINAAAVEFAGEKDIRKMIMDAQKEAVRRGLSTDDFERHSDLVDIAVSSGEVTVAPHLVKIIGEDRLEKINKRGLRKTEQRIAQNGQQPVQAAYGGFLA